jgi:hypothetical protein
MMATNPRIPDRHDIPTLQEQRKEKKPGSPLVPLGILVAALLLIALIIWLPRAPKETAAAPSSAAIPAQPTGSQVQLSDLRISPSTVGGQVYVYGKVFNNGNTSINGLQVDLTFNGANGQSVGTVTAPVQAVKDGVGVDLVDQPIQPNETRDIRMSVTHAPQDWNHQLPRIQVQTVTAAAPK